MQILGKMNIFRFLGDMSHVFSIIVLLLRLRVAKNANGISLKTQELFLIVFVARYLDLPLHFYSLYNTFMKMIYISATGYIVYMIRKVEPLKSTYDKSQDSFKHLEFAVAPSAILTVIFHLFRWRFDLIEMCWEFSVILESITIIPQLITLQRYREVENLTSNYIFFLGLYRGMYLFNWVYRSYYEEGYRHHYILYVFGMLQTALYLDFFYYYAIAKFKGQRMALPS
mmetsp:Transcript_384/g.1463  ORF Transcript_384/g.1463 Transcript_384/m.1463 type:complete len:227 (-) Transcript_384:184-864(-)